MWVGWTGESCGMAALRGVLRIRGTGLCGAGVLGGGCAAQVCVERVYEESVYEDGQIIIGKVHVLGKCIRKVAGF